MLSLIAALLVMVGSCFGQNCSELIKKYEDKVTGEVHRMSKNKIIITDKTKKSVGVIFQFVEGIVSIDVVGDGNCIDAEAKIFFLFTDGTRMNLEADNKFNCEGDASFYFGLDFGRHEEIRLLRTKLIETIRIYGYQNKVYQYDFPVKEANLFKDTLGCI